MKLLINCLSYTFAYLIFKNRNLFKTSKLCNLKSFVRTNVK